MNYEARAFPVKVSPRKAYDFGVKAGGVSCELTTLGWRAGNPLVWWDPGSFNQERDSGAMHGALDIMAPLGARVVAARSGRVLGRGEWLYNGERRDGAGWSTDGGWYVRVATPDGGSDYYAHLRERPRVRPGQRVYAGQTLGEVGQTGNAASTCPHLHYGVRAPGGAVVNPTPQLAALFERGGWVERSIPPVAIAFGLVATGGMGIMLYYGGRFVQDR